jgi:murein DD-endopeptidase MepM/ murein hydrolase activator NlpD
MPGVASVDLGNQPSLVGTRATLVNTIELPYLQSIAAEQAVLGASFEPRTSLTIEVERALTGDGVPVVFDVSALPALPAGSVHAIYLWLPSDEDDGAPGMQPLVTHYDAALRQLRARLPDHAFEEEGAGRWRARLMVGATRLFMAPPPPATANITADAERVSRLNFEPKPDSELIPCPLAEFGCLERSMFNDLRQRPATKARRHGGIDFSAPCGRPVYVEPGGRVVFGRTFKQWREAAAMGVQGALGAGITVSIQYGSNGSAAPRTLSFFHLDALAPSVLTASTDEVQVGKELTAPTGAPPETLILVGWTGRTGAGELQDGSNGCTFASSGTVPHLHMELVTGSQLWCTGDGNSIQCGYVQSNADPFPYLIKSIGLARGFNNQSVPLEGAEYFQLLAQDKRGIQVWSDVGSAVEAHPGDPTRKVCADADDPSLIAVDRVLQPGEPGYAAPAPGSRLGCWRWADIGVLTASVDTAVWPVDSGTATLQLRFSTGPKGFPTDVSLSPLWQLRRPTVAHWRLELTGVTSFTPTASPVVYAGLDGISGSISAARPDGNVMLFDAASPDVLIAATAGSFPDRWGLGFVRDVRPLGWRATNDTISYSVPISHLVGAITRTGAPASTLLEATRSVTLRVTRREKRRIEGTYSVASSMAYFPSGDPYIDELRIHGVSATGTWQAVSVPGRKPRTNMMGNIDCSADNSAWPPVCRTSGNYGDGPGQCPLRPIPNACVFDAN